MEKQNNRLRHMLIALCVGVIITFAFSVYADKTEQSLSHGLIRLHVIANSDTEYDQQLKLAVRDAIIDEVGTHFADNCQKTRQGRRYLPIPKISALLHRRLLLIGDWTIP